jgi:predicted porin
MTSLKKLTAVLAVSLPLMAAAQTPPAAPAAPPLAQIYGTLNVNLQYTEASDATAAGANISPRAAISIDSTNIGVRGTLAVDHGLKVVYQCETQASIDGEDTRALCNRNSRVGFTGGWGTLFYGNWDTPYKALAYGTKADDPLGNTDVFGYQGIFGTPGYGVRSTAFNGAALPAAGNAGFDQRAANSVAYWTPKISGLSGRVQYSVNEFRTADGRVDPQLLAAAVNFDAGGLSVGVAAEYHEDMAGIRVINTANAGTNAAKDLGLKLAAGYELPLAAGTLTVNGMVEQLTYEQENAGAGFKDYSRLAWLVGAKFRTGKHEFRARYSQALDPDITAASGTTLAANAEDDLAAQQYALGYAYILAPSTQVFAFFTQIMNEDRARYPFGVSGSSTVAGTPAGSDPVAGGIGIRYAF